MQEQALKMESQSVQSRKSLHEDYQEALTRLRSSILPCASEETCRCALKFALYEMVVDVDGSAVWTTHVEGAFAMLRSNAAIGFDSPRLKILQQAISLTENEAVFPAMLVDQEATRLTLDVIILRLRRLCSDMLKLLNASKRARKIDVFKCRTSLKRLYKNAITIHSTQASRPEACLEIEAVLIVIIDLLIESGKFLQQSQQPFISSKEYPSLLRTSSQMVNDIIARTHSKVAAGDPHDVGSQHGAVNLDAMALIWSLTIAASPKTVDADQNRSCIAWLKAVGQQEKLPKALHLAECLSGHCLCHTCQQKDGTNFRNFLTGLLLADLAAYI